MWTAAAQVVQQAGAQQFINLGAVGVIALAALVVGYRFFIKIYDAAIAKIDVKDGELRELNRSVREETVPLLRDVLVALKESQEIHRLTSEERRIERAIRGGGVHNDQ